MFSLQEIIEIVITILVVGYLFMDFARRPKLEFWEEEDRKKLFLNSCLMVIPSIIFHELAHKFTAIAFGYVAVFHAFYGGLLLGIILKNFRMPVFFIPAYVSIYYTKYNPIAN